MCTLYVLAVVITNYHKLEEDLVAKTASLYDDVESCVQNCESDAKNTEVPLTSSEARTMLSKQETVIRDLQDEIEVYTNRSEELAKKIAALQAQKQDSHPTESTCDESTRQSLLWLYSLKRIIHHSVGISDIQANANTVNITFKNG